jgi:hypothetical protein
MRSRWQFYFETEGIRFERIHEFEAEVSEADAVAFGFPAVAFKAILRIEPENENVNPVAEQTGKVHIIVPGNSRQTKQLAFWIVENAAQQITFHKER